MSNFEEGTRDGFNSPEVVARRFKKKFVFMFLYMFVIVFAPFLIHPLVFVMTFILLLFWFRFALGYAAEWKERGHKGIMFWLLMLLAAAVGGGSGFLISHFLMGG